MSLSKIFVNSFYYGVIPKISTLINVLLLPLLTPYLTPYDYGIWGIVSSYSGIFLALAPLGLHVHLANSYFEYRKKWNLVWGRILTLFFISGFFFAVVYIGVILVELNSLDFTKRIIIAICSAVPILVFGNATLAAQLFPLKEMPGPLVFRNLLASFAAIVTSFIVIYVFRLGYWGFVLSSMVGALTTFLLFFPLLYKKEHIKPVLETNLRRIKTWFEIALPVIPHSLGFLLLSSSSRIVMAWYGVAITDIGLFSNGFLMGDYITIITTALVTALGPQLQIAYRNGDFIKYRKLYYLCQLTALSAVFCTSFWMPEIYSLLIRNDAFQESSLIASYICFANVLLPLYIFASTVMFIEKRTKQLLWLVFLPGTLNILLCLLLIPWYGYKVAIYSTLLAYWSQILIPFISSYHKETIHRWLGARYKLILLLILLVSALLLSTFIVQCSIGIKLIISLVVLFGYLFILKVKNYDVAI